MASFQTSWNLKQLYASLEDPQIERDVKTIEREVRAFAKKYRRNHAFTKNKKALLKALQDSKKLSEKTSSGKPLMYVMYVKELDSENEKARALLQQYSERLTKASNEILFFDLAVGKLDSKLQKAVLKDPAFKEFHYVLKRWFESARHQLTEPEERIMSLKNTPAYDLWVDGLEKSLNKKTVEFRGKELPIAEAQNLVSTLEVEDRRALHEKMLEGFKAVSDFAESEINAIVTNKKINDELRKYPQPYSATILGYENNEKSVLRLVETVTRYMHLSQRFYEVKRKLLKLPYLTYADRAVHMKTSAKKIPFEEAVRTVGNVFESVHPRYRAILDRFLENGQIDVYAKKGKTSGAYCSHNYSLPTFVLLNHVDEMSSLLTLAHEMGHAIHSERSKVQGVLYESYSTSVAETASTLFETLVFEDLFEKLPEPEKIAALHNRIQEDVQTIFRQIAFFNFELDLHKAVRGEGFVSKEKIAELLNRHMHTYLGDAVKLTPDDGYFFVTVSHFRRFFYVYSYAYGQLISKAIVKKYKADHSYVETFDKFLSAGGSKSPEAIFKEIGIDVMKPEFFELGLKEIEEEIDTLERLTKNK